MRLNSHKRFSMLFLVDIHKNILALCIDLRVACSWLHFIHLVCRLALWPLSAGVDILSVNAVLCRAALFCALLCSTECVQFYCKLQNIFSWNRRRWECYNGFCGTGTTISFCSCFNVIVVAQKVQNIMT